MIFQFFYYTGLLFFTVNIFIEKLCRFCALIYGFSEHYNIWVVLFVVVVVVLVVAAATLNFSTLHLKGYILNSSYILQLPLASNITWLALAAAAVIPLFLVTAWPYIAAVVVIFVLQLSLCPKTFWSWCERMHVISSRFLPLCGRKFKLTCITPWLVDFSLREFWFVIMSWSGFRIFRKKLRQTNSANVEIFQLKRIERFSQKRLWGSSKLVAEVHSAIPDRHVILNGFSKQGA